MGGALRVIQWATGNIGTRALRAVIEHPGLELAGLWVSNENKVGRDAGALCGLPDTGIIATRSVEELCALQADCVLYMRQGTDVDELCRLLASGKNIVTTRGDFHHPESMNPQVRQRIEAACAEGGTSIHSTGSSPGFITEALAIPLVSLSRRLDCLTIDEFADLSSRNSPGLLFNVMGYGQPIGEFQQARADHVKADFAASLAQLADGLNIRIDRWQAFGEYAAARTDQTIAAGIIHAGKMAAQRITIEGHCDGETRLRFRANWYASRDLEQNDWDLRPSGWRVRVAGDTPLDVAISFPVAPEDYAAFTPGLTAHRAVNAIPAVCTACPGIRTTIDMPQVLANFAA
ncbi:NAD(P)H-dependent amine dehydrogenase family protein [Sphingomonas sp. 35-24ZXX]|uniref:NAD(P)H-dependent amine dehydrogenase family protein n=1 Tax=Sphingomonas sp. 35-24ZXX TaxID=1545915 RepID=UPI00053BEAC9|nr:dihydrodipicolinate reductase [Sphingomonas sp. 35-24ZXX]